ncbi:MAG TPA: hypothetical protein DDW50_00535 [Firmicutes bacterium]|nr:hypothetical protein [Bacillota bacterium]
MAAVLGYLLSAINILVPESNWKLKFKLKTIAGGARTLLFYFLTGYNIFAVILVMIKSISVMVERIEVTGEMSA